MTFLAVVTFAMNVVPTVLKFYAATTDLWTSAYIYIYPMRSFYG